jgi:hypothetical protein
MSAVMFSSSTIAAAVHQAGGFITCLDTCMHMLRLHTAGWQSSFAVQRVHGSAPSLSACGSELPCRRTDRGLAPNCYTWQIIQDSDLLVTELLCNRWSPTHHPLLSAGAMVVTRRSRIGLTDMPPDVLSAILVAVRPDETAAAAALSATCHSLRRLVLSCCTTAVELRQFGRGEQIAPLLRRLTGTRPCSVQCALAGKHVLHVVT